MIQKGDIINEAYSMMRISGLTTEPSPEEQELALGRLEDLMAELFDSTACTGYNFEEEPDPATHAGIERSHKYPVSAMLAGRLLADYGKEAPIVLVQRIRSAENYLYSSAATPRETPYPNRQPIGGANELRFRKKTKYYTNTEASPNDCYTNYVRRDDVNDYVEDFTAYLEDLEEIQSYTLEADSGLTVLSQGISTSLQQIEYRVRVDYGTETTTGATLKIKIQITTTNSRVKTNIVYFEVLPKVRINS